MTISTRFAVAVHVLTNLAVGDGKPIRSEDLARSASTNAVVIRAILARLGAAGLTRSVLGAGGGVQLSRPPSEISLVDVYRATENTELFSLHRNAPSKKCPVGRVILKALCPVLDRARSALEDQLAAVTLEDIAADVARLGKFTIPVEW